MPKGKLPAAAPASSATVPADADGAQSLSCGAIVAACAAITGGWIAAGSVGLLARPMMHALTWVFAGVVVVAAAGSARRKNDRQKKNTEEGGNPAGMRSSLWGARLSAAVAIIVAAIFLASPLAVVNVFGIALVAAAVAMTADELARPILLIAAFAASILGLWRTLYASVPWAFLVADAIASRIGRLGGIVGVPLNLGPTFAGIDLLIVALAAWAMIFWISPPPRTTRLVYGLLGILFVHQLYLIPLVKLPELMGLAPPPPTPNPIPGIPPVLTWKETVRPLVPWNLPALAAIGHLVVIGAMLCLRRGSLLYPPAEAKSGRAGRTLRITLAIFVAMGLGVASSLWLSTPQLQAKRVVLYDKGYGNWLKPTHGDYGHLSVGMYGMLQPFARSIGEDCIISSDLSDEDLAGANVLVMIYPAGKTPFVDDVPREPLTRQQLDCIAAFVRNGGTLLLFGEHTIHESLEPVNDDRPVNQFNAVLERCGSSMYVRFDSAMMQIGGWLNSYEQVPHPATSGIGNSRNTLGVVTGASVNPGWKGQPLIVGQWGFNDPGDDGNPPAFMGNHQYDAGERLGDIVLAAEQHIGKGRIILFGDTSPLGNSIIAGSHPFLGRLFAYAADGGAAKPMWRQAICVALGIALAGLLVCARSAWVVAVCAAALGGSIWVSMAVTNNRNQVVPDKRNFTSVYHDAWRLVADHCPTYGADVKKIAYICSSHLEAASHEALRDDGMLGLMMTLMRDGYLTLSLDKISADRLQRADLLVCIGPQRKFTDRERSTIRNFVEQGGNLIVTAGWDCEPACRDLLNDFRLKIGVRPEYERAVLEPAPMGWFKSPYCPYTQTDGSIRYHHVRFYAGWPVCSLSEDAKDIAYGRPDPRIKRYPFLFAWFGPALVAVPLHPVNDDLPIILLQPIGRGNVVLIGDTFFATNKNLENMDGSPIEGLRENAVFWRWLLAKIEGRDWAPPRPQPQPPPETTPEDGGGQ